MGGSRRDRWPRAPWAAALAFMAACAGPRASESDVAWCAGGPVVAVGGGGTPTEVVAEALRLATPTSGRPRVVVVPHASTRDDRGLSSAEMFRAAGASEAVVLADDADAATRQLERADLVWLGGGSQDRLLDHLEATDLVGAVRAAHRRGAVVGGTSAGAAVLGSWCIAGPPDPAPYRAGAMPARDGLDLVPGVLFDQHFAERTREGRLLTAVLDAGGVLGIGIGERTAVIFESRDARVVGDGAVIVVDARRAEVAGSPDPRRSARGLHVDVLRPNDRVRR